MPHSRSYIWRLVGIMVLVSIPFVLERFVTNDRKPELIFTATPGSKYLQDMYITINDIDVSNSNIHFGIRHTTNITQASTLSETLHLIVSSGDVTYKPDGTFSPEAETILHQVETTLERSGQQYNRQDLEIKIDGHPSWYPFDWYHVRLYTQVTTTTATGMPINAPKTYFELNDPELIYHTLFFVFKPKGIVPENKQSYYLPNSLEVTLHRPLTHIALVIIVLLLMTHIVFWTLQRAYSQRYEPDESPFEVLGLNIGIILAIPDIHGLLVPEELTYAPLVDIWLLALIVASTRSVWMYVSRRKVMPDLVGEDLEKSIETLKKIHPKGTFLPYYQDQFQNIPATEYPNYMVTHTEPVSRQPLGLNQRVILTIYKK